MNILYVIGNGFDLNLGLKTSYVDFYNYYNSLSSSKKNIKFLKESISKDYINWADLELGLGQFTDQLKDKNEFNETYEDISDQLAIYLEKEEAGFTYDLIDKTKLFNDLSFPEKYLPPADFDIINSYKNKWNNKHWNINIITLNYTRSLEKIFANNNSTFQIATHPGAYNVYFKGLEHLHGYYDDRMIMGVNEVSQIKNKSFRKDEEIVEAFVKPICNAASKANVEKRCAKYIDSADLICIFGSSIGDTDNIWWDLIGNQLRKGIKLLIFSRGSEINKRRLYKALTIEREIRKRFLEKTNLDESEKVSFGSNIIIAHNTEIFSHMRRVEKNSGNPVI
jgi:hypothetical protein